MNIEANNEVGYQANILINADLETCYAAWTKKENITSWLGECSHSSDKQLSLTSDLPYHSGNHTVTNVHPNKSIEYQWYIDGWPTKLKLEFTRLENKTKISLIHSLDPTNTPRKHYMLGDSAKRFYLVGGSWQVAAYRLRRFLEGDENVEIGSSLTDSRIHLSANINVAPKHVWNSLLDAKKMREMSPDFYLKGTKFGDKAGDIYTYGWYPEGTPEANMQDGPSKIEVFEPEKQLSINWHGQSMSQVTWKLEPNGKDGTKVTFLHAPLPPYPSDEIWSYRLGWIMDLEIRKDYLEHGTKTKDWYSF